MKTSVATIVGSICLATLFSCTADSVRYANIAEDEKIPLADGRTDSIGIRINIDFPEKCGEALKKNMTAAIITSVFGEPYTDRIEPYSELEPAAAAEAWKENLIETYRKDSFDLLEIIGEENVPAGINWEAFRNGKETSRTKRHLTYTVETYDYTGGAHGIGYEFNMNFDIRTGKLLLKEDIFKDGSDEEIGKLLLKHLNDGREGEEKVVLFEEKISPNSNFSLLKDGITFTYNRYDIAAYAYGIIDIFVPAEEISPYTNPDLKLY